MTLHVDHAVPTLFLRLFILYPGLCCRVCVINAAGFTMRPQHCCQCLEADASDRLL